MKRFREAIERGYIEEHEITGPKQRQIEKTKILASIINFAQRKRQRGLLTLDNL